jgi:hypothetical protein
MNVIPIYGETSNELLTNMHQDIKITPTLGIVFSSVSIGIRELATGLASFPGEIIGCSSCGEIFPKGDDYPISDNTAVGLFVDLNPAFFKTKLFPRNESDTFTLGVSIGTWGKSIFSEPVFLILTSGLQNDNEQIVEGIGQSFSQPVKVFGGVAGDDGLFQETFVFRNGVVSSDGVSVIVFDSQRIEIEGIVTSGWVSLGIPKIITHSEGNIVYTIDNKPVIDIYKDYLNLKEDELTTYALDFPLIIHRNNHTSIIRAPVGNDPEKGSMTFAGTVPVGSKVSFSTSSGVETIRNSIKAIETFAPVISKADMLLLFSCMARHRTIGDSVIDEILAAYHHATVPLVGFFTYGEIGNSADGSCEFHNETYVLVTFTLK